MSTGDIVDHTGEEMDTMIRKSTSKAARVVIGSCALALSALAITGCTSGAATSPPEQSAVPVSTPDSTVEPMGSDIVTQVEAERAAVAAVGQGRATWSGPEDDLGAAWEVEVTRPDGSEVDVLVAADGTVIDMIERFGVPARPEAPRVSDPGSNEATGGSGATGGNEATGVIDREQAMRIAVESVGGGQVTWVGREDDRGAAWEVEVTRPDGSEVDVLVDAVGTVIR